MHLKKTDLTICGEYYYDFTNNCICTYLFNIVYNHLCHLPSLPPFFVFDGELY